MPVDLSETLVVGISSTALFDLAEADQVFREQGMSAYRQHMLEREDAPLAPGTAMPLVHALLELKARTPAGESPYAEVVVMSQNSPETGTRIFNSIRSMGLGITRSAFTGGESLAAYVPAFGIDLFLSRS
ncbi:MAG: 5'-nucleotidase, partial [Myxococcota bacterium]